MAISGAISAAVSGLKANATRVRVAADNIANVRTENYTSKDVRTVSVESRDSKESSYESGIVRAQVIEEARNEVDLTREFTRLIQAETAYKANLETLRVAEELAQETLDIKA